MTTFATLENFKMYCFETGIQDAHSFCEDEHSFYCMSNAVRMTSYLMAHFTQWKDTYNSKGEYSGYTFRLSKKDVHNINITSHYFDAFLPKDQKPFFGGILYSKLTIQKLINYDNR